MSKSRIWTYSTLRSRGWNDALMAQLLPPPKYRHFNGRRVRTWSRDDVLQGEEAAAYKEAARMAQELRRDESEKAKLSALEARQAVTALLEEIWQSAQHRGDSADLMALRYHEAIMRQLPGAAWMAQMSQQKAIGSISSLLSLRTAKSGAHIGSILRRFIAAMPWLGQSLSSRQAEELKSGYVPALINAGALAVNEFSEAQPEADVKKLLSMDPFPAHELLDRKLGYIYSVFYIPRAIRSDLEVLVALNPKDEYPEARAMQRHFVLHIGGTNTGKTYAGFQELIGARTGVYLAPLRLLALEAQERLLDAGVKCSLTTGEEEDSRPGDTHVAATAEKLDLSARYEVAVIDECQMIADRQRGYAWTRAILGVLAPEIHLCAAPQARQLLLQLIKSCGDTVQVIVHQRKTPLLCMTRQISYDSVQPGDALIAFSKIGVLSIAEDLRSRGKKPAIIYGALPYATRRAQVEGFLDGEMQYVVSTDAIGMGLNLPIRRVIFMETEKFDGVERRQLKPEEIQQIAGRAGRYGIYDKGYVGAMQDLSVIRQGLEAVVPPLEHAVAGFSELVLNVDFDLLEVLTVWNRMPTPDPYIKLDISRYIAIISRLRELGFSLTREQELRAANIPFDETESELWQLFCHFLRLWQQGEEIAQPSLPERSGAHTLPELELYCRALDLYFSFSKAFGIDIDRDELYDMREITAAQINQILLHNLQNNIRFCPRCGSALPLHQTGRLCAACYRKMYGARPAPNHSRGRRRGK